MEALPLPKWKLTFRLGFAPAMTDAALIALADGLRTDDKRLVQGATTVPPPLMCVRAWPCEAACAIGFAGWIGEGLKTVVEVEEFFAAACFSCDERLGEIAACRTWLNFWDDTPRAKAFPMLLEEIETIRAARQAALIA